MYEALFSTPRPGSAVARVRKLASSGPLRFADDSNILEFSTTTIDTT